MLTPLLNAAVYFLIFGILLHVSRGIENYLAYLVIGVFVFNFTQRAFISTSKVIADSLPLIRALQFPRAALPLAYVIIEFQQMLLSMGVLVVIVLATGEPLTWYWLLAIPALLPQTSSTWASALFVARIGLAGQRLQPAAAVPAAHLDVHSGVPVQHPPPCRSAPPPGWIVWVLQINPAALYITLMRSSLLETSPAGRKPGSKPYNQYLCGLWRHQRRADLLSTTAVYCHRYDGPPLTLWYYAIGWAAVASRHWLLLLSGRQRRNPAVAEPMVVADNLHIVYRVYGGMSIAAPPRPRCCASYGRQTRPTIREVHAVKDVLHGVQGRRDRPDRPQRLRQVDPAAGDRRAAPAGGRHLHRRPAVAARRQRRDDGRPDRRPQRHPGLPGDGHVQAETEERYDDIVEFSGVGDFIDLPMSTYSSGMGSRLKFAIAAAKTHDILLVDEALATGDAEFRVARPDQGPPRGGRLRLPGRHNLEEVLETCNRAIWMERGRIVMPGARCHRDHRPLYRRLRRAAGHP